MGARDIVLVHAESPDSVLKIHVAAYQVPIISHMASFYF